MMLLLEKHTVKPKEQVNNESCLVLHAFFSYSFAFVDVDTQIN